MRKRARPPRSGKPRRISPLRSAVTALAFLFLLALIVAKITKNNEYAFMGAFRVVDGDTLSLGGERLRLEGVDAPELTQACDRDGVKWACGRASRERLVQLISEGPVQCVGERRDKYRRLLVSCSLESRDINAELVRDGMAVSYGGYQAEENEARAAERGIWAGAFEYPEDWRRLKGARDREPGWLASFLCVNFDVLCTETGGNHSEAF